MSDKANVTIIDGQWVDEETGELLAVPTEFEGVESRVEWLATQYDEARGQESAWAARKGFLSRVLVSELRRLDVDRITSGAWQVGITAFNRETVNESVVSQIAAACELPGVEILQASQNPPEYDVKAFRDAALFHGMEPEDIEACIAKSPVEFARVTRQRKTAPEKETR